MSTWQVGQPVKCTKEFTVGHPSGEVTIAMGLRGKITANNVDQHELTIDINMGPEHDNDVRKVTKSMESLQKLFVYRPAPDGDHPWNREFEKPRDQKHAYDEYSKAMREFSLGNMEYKTTKHKYEKIVEQARTDFETGNSATRMYNKNKPVPSSSSGEVGQVATTPESASSGTSIATQKRSREDEEEKKQKKQKIEGESAKSRLKVDTVALQPPKIDFASVNVGAYNELKNKLADLGTQEDNACDALAELKKTKKKLEKQITELEKDLNKTKKSKTETLKSLNKQKEDKRDEYKDELASINLQIEKSADKVKELRAAYSQAEKEMKDVESMARRDEARAADQANEGDASSSAQGEIKDIFELMDRSGFGLVNKRDFVKALNTKSEVRDFLKLKQVDQTLDADGQDDGSEAAALLAFNELVKMNSEGGEEAFNLDALSSKYK